MGRRGMPAAAVLLGALLLGGALQAQVQAQDPNVARLVEAWATLTGRHFRELTPDEQQALVEAAIRAMEAKLQGQETAPAQAAAGPTATTVGPGRAPSLGRIPIIGRLFGGAGPQGAGGIGVELEGRLDAGGTSVTVRNVLPGTPAEAAGMQAGDQITAVDGTPIADLANLEQIAQAVRGEPGTEVQLEVLRGEEPLTITIERGSLQATVPTAQAQILNGLAHVTLGELRESTPRECAQAIRNLDHQGQQAAKPRGLLLDLIGASGGDLEVAQALAGLFIEGPVARIRYRDGKEEVREAITPEEPLVLPELPMVVLVDDHTSGPAVLLAAALRDAGLAEVLGLPTQPAGGLTEPVKLADGTEVHVVTAGFLAPNGDDHSTLGLQPDVLYEEDTAQAAGAAGDVQFLPGALTIRRRVIAEGEEGAGAVTVEITPGIEGGQPPEAVWGLQDLGVTYDFRGNLTVLRGDAAAQEVGHLAQAQALAGEEAAAAAGEEAGGAEAPAEVDDLDVRVAQLQQGFAWQPNIMWAGPQEAFVDALGVPGMGAWDGRHWAMVQWAAGYLNQRIDGGQ